MSLSEQLNEKKLPTLSYMPAIEGFCVASISVFRFTVAISPFRRGYSHRLRRSAVQPFSRRRLLGYWGFGGPRKGG